jgi:hypothetical protein
MPQIFAFWQRWLVVVTLGWIVFSMALVIAPGLTRQIFSLLIYTSPSRIDGFGGEAVAYISLLHAVLGAMMLGWSVACLCIVIGPFKRMSFQAWAMLAGPLMAWFIPDTVYSLWSGFWQNAAFNGVFIALFAVPLMATYTACRNPPNAPSVS